MDEATANLDFQTDNKIQQLFNKYFKQNTLITIAHRINTIISYDKILVLDKGKILEFDLPKNLLNDKNSYLYNIHTKGITN